MDGTDGGSEPWLLELRADGKSRFDLEVDIRLVSTLWDLGTTGVTEIDGRLVAGFVDRGRAHAAAQALRSLTAGAGTIPASGIDIESKAAGPGPIDPGLTPSTVQLRVGDTVRSISVVAGPTFGHGHHPTTELALDLLGSALHRASAGRSFAELRMLDFGTGSGILGVAGAKAGAGSVVAVDVDAACRPVVRANAENNGVQVEVVIGVVEARPGTSLDPPLDIPFDVIVANLLLVEHIDVCDTIRRLLAPDGHLVLTGYLIDQADRVLRLYPDLIVEQSQHNGDWYGHLLTERGRSGDPNVGTSKPMRRPTL